ncbi:MAG: mitochondrial fission ELM1 family protein [Acetobacteraceae bacterium]|nr:mitochondrial fission ELM1 family protein [Acetobacteraceae bacterium]MBV8524280.1 mitochondrial fission ELM1 family protein [Acetobacteraceae bacterium]
MAPWVISSDYAGLQAQALGLAEAAGLSPELRVLVPRAPWRWVAAAHWPAPLAAVPELRPPWPGVVIGAGGVAAAVGAALRRRGQAVVQVQHPRMDPRRFDVVVVNRHDGLTGANVVVTRTALHRVTPERLAAAAAIWRPRLAHLPRPLVAVLVGGSNGRLNLDVAVGQALGVQLAAMIRQDRIGLALTPSRRTGPAVTEALTSAVRPLGGWVWDGAGENPYYGLLGLADAIVVTQDSVSMISEAVATPAPVMVAALPGRSRRQGAFLHGLVQAGRVRMFTGRLEAWPVAPLNDTQAAASEVRRRLGF